MSLFVAFHTTGTAMRTMPSDGMRFTIGIGTSVFHHIASCVL